MKIVLRSLKKIVNLLKRIGGVIGDCVKIALKKLNEFEKAVLDLPIILLVSGAFVCLVLVFEIGVRPKYLSHVESMIDRPVASNKPIKDSISIEQFSAAYEAVSTATGNYITGVAALITLILLALQFKEIRDSRKRYEQEKIDSDTKLSEEKVRHEELMIIEKEKLRLEKVNGQKNEIYRMLGAVRAEINGLEYELHEGRGKLSGKQLLETWKMHFDEYAKLAIFDKRSGENKKFCDVIFKIHSRIVDVISMLLFVHELSLEFEDQSRGFFRKLYEYQLDEVVDLIIGEVVRFREKYKEIKGGERNHIEMLGILVDNCLEWEKVTQSFGNKVYGLKGYVRAYTKNGDIKLEILDEKEV